MMDGNELNLYQIVKRAVEDQIKSNNPPATRETYERLLSEGNDEITAKEKIASVIAESIYQIMMEDRKIDEKIFSQKLASLK
ncbi:MAG: DUF1841 family protein [Spirochaetes bacterium]|jgi:hypothetical protein|nr:DUF1841 family protein [Spirochaetota bacterium]